MKIYKNFFSDQLLYLIEKDLNQNLNLNNWSAGSLLIWGSDLKLGVNGTCLSSLVAEHVKTKLCEKLLTVSPKYEKISVMYQIWHPQSGISMHNDGNYKFGATIYLNDDWDINWGGLFIWEDKITKKLNVLFPTKNTLVLNDNSERHMVTMVSPLAQKIRKTIQIFAK